uniref:Uncharacterized protein n=1 Tax=Parascaris univalens TaxID=6257 RepID=A0A915B9N3_PARUN
QKYLAPIMLGYTVGNAQQNLIAVLCQDNTFMSLLDNTFTKQLISGEPSDEERCIYIKEPDFKMYFLPCDTTSQILCDRPYEKDYCGIEINCSYARTTLSLMRTMTIMREMDTTHLKINQPTAKENMDETTSINQMHLSTAKNRTATMEKTTAEEAVTALWSRADGSHIEQGHGLFATSGSDTTTSVDNHKTESSPLSTSARPPTTSASPTGSSTTSAGEKCPSGSVYLFDWCIPWWIFLITALILLFLLLCCLAWILHCCCKILVHRCQVKSTVINRRISTDHKGNQTEAEVFEGNGTKDLKAKKRISSNSDVVSFSGSEYQNAHCDYIPAPVEAAPIPVIFAPNDDGEKKSETKAAAIIRQATGTEISSAKGSDDHICSHEEVMAKMADISVAANRLSSEHESQNGDESKREFPLNPNSFEKNESVCDMANESTVTKRIRNKPFNEGSQESPRAEKEPRDVTKTNNYEKDAGNSQLMSPRRFPSPAPSLVQFSEPPPRMTIVNPEVASRSPRVSCAASQRGVSPKNRPVTLPIFSSFTPLSKRNSFGVTCT